MGRHHIKSSGRTRTIARGIEPWIVQKTGTSRGKVHKRKQRVGIDVTSETLAVYVRPAGRAFQVANSSEGLAILVILPKDFNDRVICHVDA